MQIMAAIDLETTGLDVDRCEIIDMAVVPLNADFTVSTEIPEFTRMRILTAPNRNDRPPGRKGDVQSA